MLLFFSVKSELNTDKKFKNPKNTIQQTSIND